MTDELEVTALAAGGDGVARDEGGRVTFIPRSAVGDRVRVQLGKQTKSFARGEITEIVTASPDRVTPPCEYYVAGCGGCTWQHIGRPAQLAAKQAIVTGALRKLEGLAIEPIADPAPPYGWRRANSCTQKLRRRARAPTMSRPLFCKSYGPSFNK
jgi:tRNA/tmRNA/rRNA uracil-C5-methylase (TrmA/RlmC/RlmD family)